MTLPKRSSEAVFRRFESLGFFQRLAAFASRCRLLPLSPVRGHRNKIPRQNSAEKLVRRIRGTSVRFSPRWIKFSLTFSSPSFATVSTSRCYFHRCCCCSYSPPLPRQTSPTRPLCSPSNAPYVFSLSESSPTNLLCTTNGCPNTLASPLKTISSKVSNAPSNPCSNACADTLCLYTLRHNRYVV